SQPARGGLVASTHPEPQLEDKRCFTQALPTRAEQVDRGLVPCVLATLAIAAATVIAPIGQAPAHAAAGDLTCTATFRIDFSPPLTAANATSQASESFP